MHISMWQLPWTTLQNCGCAGSAGTRRMGRTVSLFVPYLIYVLPTPTLEIRGVIGHFIHPYNRPWVKCCDDVTPLLAELVGEL